MLTRCAAAALLSATLLSAAHSGVYREEAVKAAFLFRFAGYIDWPDNARPREGFTFAVLGAPGVQRELERLLPGRSVKGVPARVQGLNVAPYELDAQVLYVGREFGGDLAALLNKLSTRPMLLITDRPQGIALGSAINFVLLDQRVRFEIAPAAIARARLRARAELLAVAVKVHGDPRVACSGESVREGESTCQSEQR